MMKKRIENKMIAFVGPFTPLGGAGIKNYIFFNTLIDKGYKINKIDTLNWKRKIFQIVTRIYKLNRVILAVSIKGRFLLLPILFCFKKIKKDFKYVIVPMGGNLNNELNRLPKFLKKMYVLFINNSDYLFVETYKLCNSLKEDLGIKNVIRLPNFKEKKAIKKPKRESGKIKIIYISYVRKSKGVETGLKAIKQLVDNNLFEIKFDIYGPIKEGYKKQFRTVLGYYNFANYYGKVEKDKVVDVIADYDIFLFPTYYIGEGFPGILIDALMANISIIVSDYAYNGEIIKDNENGLLFKVKDVDDLSDKIKMMIENKKLQEKFVNNNKEYVKRYFAETVVDNFLNYLEIINWFN